MAEAGQTMSEEFKTRLEEDIRRGVDQKIQDAMRTAKEKSSLNRGPGVTGGVILVIIGSAILLDHMGIVRVDRIWQFWPLILIVVGLVKFFKEKSAVFGIGIIAIGVILQLNLLGLTHFVWADLWPLAIITVGLLMITSRIKMPQLPTAVKAGEATPETADMLNEYAVFGGVDRRVHTQQFKGGTIVATFGGVKLDLRTSEIEGEMATIHIEALFGGVELVLPERWKVSFIGQNVFGAFTDETRPPLPDATGAAPRKVLLLTGNAVFGGINVKN